MSKHTSLIILLLAASLSLLTGSADSEKRTYREFSKRGEAIHHFIFHRRRGEILITLRSDRSGTASEHTYLTGPDLSDTRRWTYRNPDTDTDITAVRTGDHILLRGIHKGRNIQKNFKINHLPWNQVFHIGLEAAATRGDKAYRFWSIGTEGPGEMKITTFKVKRVDEPVLQFNGESVPTRRYQISLSGLLSVFWKGYYWYRLTDGRFLLYREKGKEGSDDPIMKLIAPGSDRGQIP